MKKLILLFLIPLTACQPKSTGNRESVRTVADTIGFAREAWQMDRMISFIDSLHGDHLGKASMIAGSEPWKVALCPHDDYAYAGYLYPAILQNIKAGTVVLIGVAHKARERGLEDRIIFDSYDKWKGPYGQVTVSGLREDILEGLSEDLYLADDTMHAMEHSLEALIPYLQYFNRQVEIVPILVPYMNFSTMENIALPLADQLNRILKEKKFEWGLDIAIVISSDAVHYGDEDWSGRDFAFFGSDSIGYENAVAHEYKIIEECLTGELSTTGLEKFMAYTVTEKDHREYKWTWCGRYSVPFGLLAAFYLARENYHGKLKGTLVGYETSLSLEHLPVETVGMGVTAPAKIRHWVGYTAVGYR